MNLSISPISFNNYSATQNYRRNNNQTQNFQALPITVFQHPAESRDVIKAFEKRDKVVDVFSGVFEEISKRIGIDTNKMAENGFSLEFIPKFRSSSKMRVSLVDKKHDIVTCGRHQKPITTNISATPFMDEPYGIARQEAENLAYMIKAAKLNQN